MLNNKHKGIRRKGLAQKYNLNAKTHRNIEHIKYKFQCKKTHPATWAGYKTHKRQKSIPLVSGIEHIENRTQYKYDIECMKLDKRFREINHYQLIGEQKS
jgi:hypothetical protein